MDWIVVSIVAVVFFATLVRSTLGFGEALIGVPLLSLMIPVEVAAPAMVLVSITIAGVMLAQDWRHVHLRSAGWLMVFTCLGIPLGLLMLVMVVEGVVKGVLAAVIIVFSLYCLAHRRPVELSDDRLAWFFGFGAGVLGGAYGMNGPPLVVYGTLRRWSPEHFRATLQGYFLPAGVVGMIGYWFAGLWVADVTRYYLLSLVPMLAAVVIGRAISQRMDKQTFLTCVHVGLILVGAVLLVQAVW